MKKETKKEEKKYKKGDTLCLTWLDAFGNSAWLSDEQVNQGLENPISVIMVGIFIKEDENFIVLTMGINNDALSMPYCHIEFIPKGCIKKIEKV